jgi:hypothetical protein
VEWKPFIDRLRVVDQATLPQLLRDLLDFYETVDAEGQEGTIRLIDGTPPADTGAMVAQVVRAMQSGDASVLTRSSSRDVTNGTPHSTAPMPLFVGAATLLELLDGGSSGAVRRYLCAQACLLALAGVPEISPDALFGLREPADEQALLDALRDAGSTRYRITSRFLALLNTRRAHNAFHPAGQQIVLDLSSAVFGLERISPDGRERVIALHNVTSQVASIEFATGGVRRWRNLHLDEPVDIPAVFTYRIVLSPFQVAWLRAE